MLSYLTIGANDIPRSERFYTAVLGPLGYEKAEQQDGVAYTLPDSPDRADGPCALYVRKPYDGLEATAGNGSMIAFRVFTPCTAPALRLGAPTKARRASAPSIARISSWVICAIRWATS